MNLTSKMKHRLHRYTYIYTYVYVYIYKDTYTYMYIHIVRTCNLYIEMYVYLKLRIGWRQTPFKCRRSSAAPRAAAAAEPALGCSWDLVLLLNWAYDP